MVIGSHCVGPRPRCSGSWQREGLAVKALWVGSMGGLAAAKRGECDIAGVPLLDPETGEYNAPFLTPGA